ncbi:MAG: flagellar biosynthetic protein FliR [Acidobacteriales bacterium]|nr:flagellar biosynthetic protein FliR [Terriglobales bacterium]
MPELSVEQTLAAWMIAGSRVTGLLIAAPFLGSLSVPVRIKLGMAFVLTMLLVPLVSAPAASMPASALVSMLVGEVAIGFLLGFTLQFFFDAALVAGHVLGIQMGYSLASVINPQSQADSPVLATFHELVVLLLFIQLQVPHWLLRGLGRSFQYLPPGHFVLTGPAMAVFLQFTGGLWVAAVQIAAPVLVATMFADVALGFLGKASPQLPVLFVGLSIKSLLGLALLCGAVALWPRVFDSRFQQAMETSERILKLAH